MVIAAFAVGLAIWLWCSPGLERLRSPRIRGPATPRRWLVAVAIIGLWVATAVVAPGVGLVAVVVATLISVTALRLALQYRRRRARATTEVAVERACWAISAELRAGRQLRGALEVTAREHPLLADVGRRIRLGQEPHEALAAVGNRPGAHGLVDLARGWEVAERTGASPAELVDRVAEAVRERAEVAGVVAAELAAPRATGQVLGLLPLAGLVLGAALGVDPLGFLLGHTAGQVIGVVGVALACAGLLWSDRLAEEK